MIEETEKSGFSRLKTQELSGLVKDDKNRADEFVEQALLAKAVGFSYIEQELASRKEIFYENGKKVREISEPVVLEVSRFKPAEYNAQVFWLINRKPELWKDKKDIKPPQEELVRIIDDITSVSEKDGEGENN